MISPYVKKLARETGKSEKEISGYWEKAKKITSETFGVKEDDFTSEHFEFAITTVKNMLGLSEEIVNPANFLQSDLNAKEYIETMVSGNFSVGDKNPVVPPKGKKVVDLKGKKDDEDEEEKDKLKEGETRYNIKNVSLVGYEEITNYLDDTYPGLYNPYSSDFMLVDYRADDSRLQTMFAKYGVTEA